LEPVFQNQVLAFGLCSMAHFTVPSCANED
jgi:hypothetical protein